VYIAGGGGGGEAGGEKDRKILNGVWNRVKNFVLKVHFYIKKKIRDTI